MTQKKSRAKISHSLEELEEGAILTVQDRPVILNGEINDEDDVFEDHEKQRENQIKHNQELKSKMAIVSSAITSHTESMNEGQKKLLPHYDDYKYKSQLTELEDGQTTKRARPKLQTKLASDFETTNNVGTEYYERNNKFKHRKKQKQTCATDDLLSFLNETAVEKDIPSEVNNFTAEDLIEQSLNTVRKRKKLENEHLLKNDTEAINEDEELLSKAIKMGRQKNTQQNSILSIIKEQGEDQHKEAAQNFTEIDMNFVNHKQTISNTQFKKVYNITDAAKGTTSCLFVNLPSEKIVLKTEQKKQLPTTFKDLTPEELQKMKQEISFMEQKSVDTGLSGTLEYLRQNKLLNRKEQFGRTNDEQLNHNAPEDRVKIQYINSSGKEMTPKQAFRYLSAKFHGQGPGKNKVQKMKKREILEMKMKEAANGPSKLMTLLEKHQNKTGEAHLIIQLGSKNKQE